MTNLVFFTSNLWSFWPSRSQLLGGMSWRVASPTHAAQKLDPVPVFGPILGPKIRDQFLAKT